MFSRDLGVTEVGQSDLHVAIRLFMTSATVCNTPLPLPPPPFAYQTCYDGLLAQAISYFVISPDGDVIFIRVLLL